MLLHLIRIAGIKATRLLPSCRGREPEGLSSALCSLSNQPVVAHWASESTKTPRRARKSCLCNCTKDAPFKLPSCIIDQRTHPTLHDGGWFSLKWPYLPGFEPLPNNYPGRVFAFRPRPVCKRVRRDRERALKSGRCSSSLSFIPTPLYPAVCVLID